jgi:ribA/ribD-fused uncharacterized protein
MSSAESEIDRPIGGSAEAAPATGAVPPDGRILFYRRDREGFGFLSNFHQAPIRLDDEDWPTAEHYYQAQKSLDPEYRRQVRATATPGRAKRLGADPDGPVYRSRGSWFRASGRSFRAGWMEMRADVMRRTVLAKFLQNPELAERLLATGDAEIVEDSGTDTFWGAGPDGTGQNQLGLLLVEVRAELARRRDATTARR